MAEVCRRLASFSETQFRGLIWFLKAPRPCKPPFHLTRAIWNNFALKAGLWLKTKGCLSQRAGFLPPAFEKRSQQIMVNKWTKASPCADAGRPASKRRSKTTQRSDAHDQNLQGLFSCVLSSAFVASAVETADMWGWWMINLRGQWSSSLWLQRAQLFHVANLMYN